MARTHARKDWAALKAAYRRGEGSIAQLAPRFRIAKSTAEKRCAREKWQVERQEVGKKADEKARERDVESLAAMLARHREVANLAVRLSLERMKRVSLEDQVAQEAADIPGLDTLGPSPLEELEVLTKVVARMVPVERLAAGIDRIKPVKPVELTDDDEVSFDVDLPPEEEAAPSAPAKA